MALASILVILDQISKLWILNNQSGITIIDNLLRFTYVENHGAIFGLFQGSNDVMIILSALICVGLVIYSIISYKNKKALPIEYYFIVAGGIGNLIDRITRGYVIDFIDTPFIATFNLADSFIVIGVFTIILKQVKELIKSGK